jgi:hypothetical protein
VYLVAEALENLGILDEHIRQGADLPVLLMTAAHLTGDYSLLRPEWKPTVVFGKLRCEVPSAERDTILRECARRLGQFAVPRAS